LACLVVVVWLGLRGSPPRADEGDKPAVQKWEYFSTDITGFGAATDHQLNELGDRGWELCTSVGNQNFKALFFKRPKQ